MFAVLLSAASKAKALLIMPGEHIQMAQQGPASHPTETHQMAGANPRRNGAKEKVAATSVCSGEAMHAVRVLAAVVFALVIGMTDLISCGMLSLPASAGSDPEV